MLDSYSDKEDKRYTLVNKGSGPHLSVLDLCSLRTRFGHACPLAMVMFAGKSERTCGGRIPDTGRTHDDVGSVGLDLKESGEGMRKGTGTLVDPQTRELTRGYTGLNIKT